MKALEIVKSRIKYCQNRRILVTDIMLEELDCIKEALEQYKSIENTSTVKWMHKYKVAEELANHLSDEYEKLEAVKLSPVDFGPFTEVVMKALKEGVRLSDGSTYDVEIFWDVDKWVFTVRHDFKKVGYLNVTDYRIKWWLKED